MLRKLFAFVALPMILSCAPFQQANANNNLAPQQSSLIDATCRNVMGLRPGEEYYADCLASLTHSLVFAQDRESSTSPQHFAISTQPVASADGSLENGRSYYNVTPTTRWNRERYACAQLGLMPNGGLFGQCVGSLDSELMPDE